MKINNKSQINFQRQLKPQEEAKYVTVLKEAKEKIGNKGKSVLIVPASSLPNKTGVGNLGTKEGLEFLGFAKKYWGINEVQILPMGQYFEYQGKYPLYSGTSMDIGNHVINIKEYVSENDYQKILSENKDKTIVNFQNIIQKDSIQEKVLKNLYKDKKLDPNFIKFKELNKERLEPKALYNILQEIHNSHDYKSWPQIDQNLYDNAIDKNIRNNRIKDLYNIKNNDIDFYYFKQYLAEDSLKISKDKLNQKGLKLSGDMLCGFSYDEVWSNPDAFHKNSSIGWGLPALNLDTIEGQNLLRKKVNFYANHYDNLRIDASWTYARQPIIKNGAKEHKYYRDRILNIIDDEILKVKGKNYNLKNIMHEFTASPEDFNSFKGSSLRPYIADRTKIYTSDHLNSTWGSNYSYIKRGWDPANFIIGATNHDSINITYSDTQAKELSNILKISYNQLKDKKEFVKAKLAEPMAAFNQMLYFKDALGFQEEYKNLDYTSLISENYKENYFKNLTVGVGFNPMDALEKNFKAKGLDKTEAKLFKEIQKYKKILEQKEKQAPSISKILIGITCLGIFMYGSLKYFNHKKSHSNSK